MDLLHIKYACTLHIELDFFRHSGFSLIEIKQIRVQAVAVA